LPNLQTIIIVNKDDTSVSSSSIVMLPLPLITQVVNVSLEPLTLLNGLVNIKQAPSISARGPSFLFLKRTTRVGLQWWKFWLRWLQWQNFTN